MAETSRRIRMNEYVRQQVQGIVEALGESEVLVQFAPDGGVSFLCHPSQVLVPYAHLESVRAILDALQIRIGEVTSVIDDVFLLKLELPPVGEWRKLYG